MLTDDEAKLDALFQEYRSACPDVEASVDFMPGIWRKIDSRHTFAFVFERLGRTVMGASAALCLLMLVLNLVSTPNTRLTAPTYMDALMADHTAEKTYYTEAIRATPASDQIPEGFEQ